MLISVLTLKDLVCITTRDLLLLPTGRSAVFFCLLFCLRTLWLKAARAQLRGGGDKRRGGRTDVCATFSGRDWVPLAKRPKEQDDTVSLC